MSTRELILLTPYRYPAQNPLNLGDEDMACWLNALTALWHPALLWQAKGPPRQDEPYNHVQPQPGFVYAVLEVPSTYLPEDWEQRVRAVGAVSFRATADRPQTLTNLQQALREHGWQEAVAWFDLQAEEVAPFFGLGLGQLLLSALSEAMEHENMLQTEAFWDDVQQGLASLAGLPYTPSTPPPASETSYSSAAGYAGYEEYMPPSEGVDYPLGGGNGEPGSPEEAGPGADGQPEAPPLEQAAPANQEEAQASGAQTPVLPSPSPQPLSLGERGWGEGRGAEGEGTQAQPMPSPLTPLPEEEGKPVSPLPEEGGTGVSPVRTGETPVPPGEMKPVSPDEWLDHLRRAAGRLLSAREVLYPVTIHLLDMWLVDEKNLDGPWPTSFELGQPLNLIASTLLLQQLAHRQPEKFALLRERVQADQAEVLGGGLVEREDPLLPLESQIWNFLQGQEMARALLGSDIRVFARKRYGFHPQLPLLLSSVGLTRALFLTFDDSGSVPAYQTCLVSWSSPDGKQVDAFVRPPSGADSASTFFNLGQALFKTTREDHVATLAFVHKGSPETPWYGDLLALSCLAPVIGQWTTLSQYFSQTTAGEFPQPPAADDFHSDFLSERTRLQLPDPVSGFARQVRLRRRLDTCWTLAALYRALAGRNDDPLVAEELNQVEDLIEVTGAGGKVEGLLEELAKASAKYRQFLPPGHQEGQVDHRLAHLVDVERKMAARLAERLQARAEANQPGYLILNPCSFIRRVALELTGSRPLPLGGPVKACQLDGERLRVVAEVPALGFAWIPQAGPQGTPAPPLRMRLADQQTNCVRNEFFEAEVDPQTGGLKAIRDRKTYLNRLGQRLVFNPGSRMQATSLQVTSAGPALGEIVSEGALLGEQNQVLAKFRQRFRAWLGRPVLELRLELFPEQPPAGYPWHAYYAARFAWRDERAALLRGVNGCNSLTTHNRPQTPDYLELRYAHQSTVLLCGGLPFHQRQESRMLDVILAVEGEKATAFELGIGLDREVPLQTALGMVTPVPVVPTTKGPPHVGATGWLFHLDMNNLLLTRLHPGGLEQYSDGRDLGDAVTARLLEVSGHGGHAEFRCVRDPQRAVLLDMRGQRLCDASASNDTAYFEVSPHDLVQLQVEFS